MRSTWPFNEVTNQRNESSGCVAPTLDVTPGSQTHDSEVVRGPHVPKKSWTPLPPRPWPPEPQQQQQQQQPPPCCHWYPWLSDTTPPAAPPEECTARASELATGWSVKAAMNSNKRAFPWSIAGNLLVACHIFLGWSDYCINCTRYYMPLER